MGGHERGLEGGGREPQTQFVEDLIIGHPADLIPDLFEEPMGEVEVLRIVDPTGQIDHVEFDAPSQFDGHGWVSWHLDDERAYRRAYTDPAERSPARPLG